jgi:RNA polymerase sigma-70 factor (ECF subfamily)
MMAAYSAYTDQELIVLLQQGDHAAFTAIYDRYAPKVFYQVNQMLRDAEVSKDLVQELFIVIWSKAAHIKAGAKLGGYLYIAAQNTVFKHIQRSKLQDNYLKSLAEFSTELSNSTVELLDEKELHLLIDHYIKELPAKMREVFELSRNQELSYQEIAAQLAISEQTVKNQVSSALKILRGKMAPHAPGAMIIMALLPKY